MGYKAPCERYYETPQHVIMMITAIREKRGKPIARDT